LQSENVNPGFGKSRYEISRPTSAQLRASILALAIEEIAEQNNPCIVPISLPRFAVANLKGHWKVHIRRDLKALRLNPEIVRSSRRSGQNQQGACNGDSHSAESFCEPDSHFRTLFARAVGN
jgi:hypothetical protein